ncbi:hypothetical protein LMB49_10895 [Limosilactobacillus reuteri]|uniref:hypothetical protein n=1 Tax=Limosilactobacillus reuteri TaxID=1598 RepID=UPI001E33BC9F|nr:hypothetical protein [Limosilactobacillus reuteri]MCC4371897.1 hypothetical protein [Limosilactobacillus reuteri]MCC4509632.1 hypothetical protein [Limosilactobacillus reuteri]
MKYQDEMKLTEKQKNCRYCHYPWKHILLENLEDDNDDAETYGQYETNGGLNDLIYSINFIRSEIDNGVPWTLIINRHPKYCEECGRPLNEEEA